MKILTIGNFTTGWDGSICDEEHIAKALEDLGHEVTRFQRETAVQVAYYERWPGADETFDFILVAQWDGFFESLYQQLRLRHKCPIVYWAFDYQADGQSWHEDLVAQADLYLSKRIADSKYPNWQWLSQDFAPEFLERTEWRETKDIDVLFTGSYLDWADERNKTIKAIGEKFDLTIHSVNTWPQGNKGPLMDEELRKLYDRAKIVISIDHTLEAGYWSDRTAQAMACGAFVMARYIPMMEVRFTQGLCFFYSIKDCLEKIEYWLDPKNAEMREAISMLGYRYAQDNLMVKNRVLNLLTIVENYLENHTI